MKLSVFMITGFPPPYGGVSVWATQLAESLTKRNVKVGCLPSRGIPPKGVCVFTLSLPFYVTFFELKWIVKKFVDLWHFGVTPFCLRFKFLYVVRALLDCVRIRSALNEETYDIVTGNHAALDGLRAVLLADLIEAKCVIYEHGAGVLYFPYIFEGAGKIVSYVLSNADMILAANEFMKEKVIGRGAKSEKVFIIPLGIDINKFQSKAKRKELILFIGSLEKYKGPGTLLKSIPSVLEKVPHAMFMFLGSGSLLPKLCLEAERLGISDRVQFLGETFGESKTRILSEAKILVLPSMREAFGMVLIEAMASGTPCIASNVGGIPELIDEKVGALVPPRDPESLASAMINLLSNEKKWRSLSMDARKRAENYDANNLIGKYIQLFLNLKMHSEIAG